MFRDMRRKKQKLSYEECERILKRNTAGVLAVDGDNNYPYAVPMSYVYDSSKIYFHCAKTGHKIDAITKNEKVSFCVIDEDRIVPEEYTTYYRSVIVFGKARIMEDETEKRMAIEQIAKRYSPDDEIGRMKEIETDFAQVYLVEIMVEHMDGKEAIELVNGKGNE